MIFLQFVKANVNKDMSLELTNKEVMETAIDEETPPYCAAWLLIDHKDHILRNYAIKN